MKGNGLRIICMEKAFTTGTMVEVMLVIMLTIVSMGMGFILGMMVDNIRVSGLMGSSMVKVFLDIRMGKRGKVNGKMANV